MHEHAVRIELVERIARDVRPLVDDTHALAGIGELAGDDAAGIAGADDEGFGKLRWTSGGGAFRNAVGLAGERRVDLRAIAQMGQAFEPGVRQQAMPAQPVRDDPRAILPGSTARARCAA